MPPSAVPEVALSLTQPWATLVALGEKRVETRSWSTKFRGRVAIHASKGFPKTCQALCSEEPFASALGDTLLPLGAVVAVATISQCHRMHPSLLVPEGWDKGQHEMAFGDYAAGRSAFLLEDVIPLEPVPCKGKLSFWRLDPEVKTKIAEQMKGKS